MGPNNVFCFMDFSILCLNISLQEHSKLAEQIIKWLISLYLPKPFFCASFLKRYFYTSFFLTGVLNGKGRIENSVKLQTNRSQLSVSNLCNGTVNLFSPNLYKGFCHRTFAKSDLKPSTVCS